MSGLECKNFVSSTYVQRFSVHDKDDHLPVDRLCHGTANKIPKRSHMLESRNNILERSR